ncbi:MAG TPA: T9SS type A sorting domain-containing protein, partial [Bacteroidia bacterium]|nr:T9SS type A sorting domain-containing protein [Bacteroidia bacterium]
MKKNILVAALLFLRFTVYSQLISTVAGTGAAGYNSDGIAATLAQLNSPAGVAVDAAGNIYIADYNNHRIRMVDIATGLISTIAGTGTAGYNGDGIPATAAELNTPYGVSLDAAANVYIADYYNNRIRKVIAATGMITTIAGTGAGGYNGDGILAINASLNNPLEPVIDPAGNVYIPDEYNHRVRKITAATGMISTIAGTGTGGYNGDGIPATAAELNFPFGLGFDGAGNLFIADEANGRIRKITVSSGLISTVAGTGNLSYNGDGIAATAADLNRPLDVDIDAAGNLYITDHFNDRIRKVTASTGLISTIAGTGIAGYNGDGIPASAAYINEPLRCTFDASGNLFIADRSNHRIRKVPNVTTNISEIIYLENETTIFPNPAVSFININSSRGNVLSVKIANAAGDEIMNRHFANNDKQSTIDVSKLTNGI